jgi:hypothetical protein
VCSAVCSERAQRTSVKTIRQACVKQQHDNRGITTDHPKSVAGCRCREAVHVVPRSASAEDYQAHDKVHDKLVELLVVFVEHAVRL